jgi:dihydrofolate synthase / folylpolyglutamate synthase
MTAIEANARAITAWLDSAVNFEKTGDFAAIRLERMHRFMTFLPRPPRPCTVTGTKGKGSTLRLIESALTHNGVATIAFTSPHISSVLERWRIDGAVAEPRAIAVAANQVDVLERRHDAQLTYFERCFAVACILAAEHTRATFLCEVGLGGRLDCANTLDARVLVVTHLSRDHCAVLGDSVADIAREKLALARADQDVVIAPQSQIGREAIEMHLRADCRPLWVERRAPTFKLALPGEHQQDNASTALAAARLLHPNIPEDRLAQGMAPARLAARCQLVEAGGRRLLIDGAHNGPSIAATIAVATAQLRPGWRLLLGLAKDKEIDEVMSAVPPNVPVSLVGYRSARARGRDDWPVEAQQWRWHEDIGGALAANASGDLCITGSFYLAGEALAALRVDSPPG